MIRLCAAEEVPLGEGRAVKVNGSPLALFRLPTGWFAVQGRCTHQAGPLADGIAAERSVICPLHERRFDLESGAPLGHDCPALRTYGVCEIGDEVFLIPSQSPIRNGGATTNGVQEPT